MTKKVRVRAGLRVGSAQVGCLDDGSGPLLRVSHVLGKVRSYVMWGHEARGLSDVAVHDYLIFAPEGEDITGACTMQWGFAVSGQRLDSGGMLQQREDVALL